MTEPVINALKHAVAEDRSGGVIVITDDAAEIGWRLTVSDNGIGTPYGGSVKPVPTLGTNIVEALAKRLAARGSIP